eukprot:PhM_4_TR15209/c0_g1_i1/m.52362
MLRQPPRRSSAAPQRRTQISRPTTAAAAAPLVTYPKADPWMCEPSSSDNIDFVVIHVHDETNRLSKDFYCNRNVLLREMRYFRSYISELGMERDEFDISVHCDASVFLWLVEYVHAPLRSAHPPQLDTLMAVSALISADFLQMVNVVPEVLNFVHEHVTEIIRLPINLDCIRRPLVQKLSVLFTEHTLLVIKDKKEKLLPSLLMYKLKEMFQHKATALFRCRFCGTLFTHSHPLTDTCSGAPQEVDHHGRLEGHHVPDTSWQLAPYMMLLRRLHLSWQQIFWRLWTLSSTDQCSRCHNDFVFSRTVGYCCCGDDKDDVHENHVPRNRSKRDLLSLVLERYPDTQIPVNHSSNNDLIMNSNNIININNSISTIATDVVPMTTDEATRKWGSLQSGGAHRNNNPPRSASAAAISAANLLRRKRTPKIDVVRESDATRMKELHRRLSRHRSDVVDTFLPAAQVVNPFVVIGTATTAKNNNNNNNNNLNNHNTNNNNKNASVSSSTVSGSSPICSSRGKQALIRHRRASASGLAELRK